MLSVGLHPGLVRQAAAGAVLSMPAWPTGAAGPWRRASRFRSHVEREGGCSARGEKRTQTFVMDIANTLPANLAISTQAGTDIGSPVIVPNSRIRHVFDVPPLEGSLYFNPRDPSDC